MKNIYVILGLCAPLCFGSCEHLTIAPKPIQVKEVAFENGEQTAGILDYDATGLIVSDGWVKKYDALLSVYGKNLPIDNRVKSGDRSGITATTYKGKPAFHVFFEVNTRFADLKYFERNSAP